MYNNSLVLRITMTEKPFLHNKAFSNLKTNFMFHEDLVKILPKLINKKGIINIGGPSQSVYSFVKKNNPNVKKIFAMIICISLLCAPIMMLVVLTMPPQESNILDFNTLSFSGLKHGGIQFFWILSTIILLTIMEGREVTKLYYLTGEISSGDRFYSMKYILGPAFLVFFIFIFGIIQSLLF